MKKIGLSSLIAGLLLANAAGAEPVAVEGGTVFILSNGVLSAKAVDDPYEEVCKLPPIKNASDATDVVISGDKAFVTKIDPTGAVSVDSFDVSACLKPSKNCKPSVDLDSGVLLIPCLEVNDQTYNITMHQRGKSMNWDVTGIEDSSPSSRNR